MTDQTPAPDPAPMSTPPLEDWATLHDRLLDAERAWKAEWERADREQRERADRTEQAEAEQAELRTENEALRDKLAVRDHELEGLRDERDLHLAAFWQAVKQRDRALAQAAIDRPAADFAEAALDRERKQHLARADAINRVIALHQPRNHNGRTICGACSDYDPSSDSSDSSAPVPYPCPTIRALDSTAQPAEEDA